MNINNFLFEVDKVGCPDDLVSRLGWCRKVIFLYRQNELPSTRSLEWLEVFDSETDEFPSGDVRQVWSDSALEKSDARLLDVFSEDLESLPKVYQNLIKEVRELKLMGD